MSTSGDDGWHPQGGGGIPRNPRWSGYDGPGQPSALRPEQPGADQPPDPSWPNNGVAAGPPGAQNPPGPWQLPPPPPPLLPTETGPQPAVPSRRSGRGRRRRRRSRAKPVILLTSCVVVVAMIAAALVYLVSSRTDYTEAWTLSGEDAQSGELLDVYAAGDVLVRATDAGVTGYDLADGSQRWRFRPPAGRHLCTISPNASGGVAVAAYGGEQCTDAVAIDTRSGKARWRAPLVTGSNEQEPRDAAAAVVDGVGVVSNGRVTAFDLKNGKQRWTIGPPDIDRCRSGDTMAEGGVLLALVDCQPRDESGKDDTLVSVDPADGKAVWLAAVKNESGQLPPRLVNVSPPVLHLSGAGDAAQYGVLDDEGKNPLVFAAGVNTEPVRQQTMNAHRRFGVTVVGHTLVEVGGNEAYGFDLTNGKQDWHNERLADSGSRGALVAGGGSGPRVSAYTVAGDGGERLLDVDSRSGATRDGPVVRAPLLPDGDAGGRVAGSSFFTANGRLVEVGSSNEDLTLRVYEAR